MSNITDRIGTLETNQLWHWGAIGAIVALLVGTMTWYLPKELSANRELSKADTRELLEPIQSQLADLKTALAVLGAQVGGLVADQVTTGRDAPAKVSAALKDAQVDTQLGLTTITEIARKAMERDVPADLGALEQVGSQVLQRIEQTATSDSAWEAAVQLASYRTEINQRPVLDAIGAPMDFDDDVIKQIFPWTFDVMVYGSDRAMEAMLKTNMIRPYGPRTSDYALIQRLGERYEPLKEGASWVVLQGPTGPQSPLTIRLDGYHFKKIVFRDLVISWRGGPMNLENVAFVRCRFAPNRSQPTRQLLREVFASSYITLQTPKT